MLKINCLCIAALLAFSIQLEGLPVGNPLDASLLSEGIFWEGHCDDEESKKKGCLSWCEAWSLRAGYYGDFVFNRRMEVDDFNGQDPDIRKMWIATNAAYLAFNLWDRIDIFSTLGQTKIYLETPGTAFLLEDPLWVNLPIRIATDTSFSWSLGARATLWQCGCFGLGAEVQYFRNRMHLNYFERESSAPIYISDARALYREYQIGFGAAYKIAIAECSTFAIPYAAVKWSRAKLNMGDYLVIIDETIYQLHRIENHSTVGAAVGVTLLGCEQWSFTAEARFADEIALHINSQTRF
jgi:major outer membrane protein